MPYKYDHLQFCGMSTQAMLDAIAPEVMNAVRTAQQASSVAPVPPEIEQILEQAASPEATPAEEELPPALQEPQGGVQ
jgi:hypothetical protein